MRRHAKRVCVALVVVATLVALCVPGVPAGILGLAHRGILEVQGKRTVADVIAEHGPRADETWRKRFAAAGAAYPPPALTLVALKEERVLEIWAAGASAPRKITEYLILGASGGPGPKLMRGDQQVPEGFYLIDALNPDSRFHLSLRVNYPNVNDRVHARDEGRVDPGDDIFIHGGTASVGCLAIGDAAIEELFVVVARTGLENTRVLLCPADFRVRDFAPGTGSPVWLAPLYEALATELRDRFGPSEAS